MEKIKVVLFDFCDTLVDFQTADAFVHFVREKSKKKSMFLIYFFHNFLISLKIIYLLDFFLIKFSINKRLVLLQLRGFNKVELDNYAKLFYEKKIKPSLNYSLIGILEEKKKLGYLIVIVSGGYDIYLKYFINDYQISSLISTRIKFYNNICKGSIDGLDCLWENKTILLNSYFINNEIDKNNSFAYSDNYSDLPMLKWVKNGVVVSKCKQQNWAIENNLIEIFWEKQ